VNYQDLLLFDPVDGVLSLRRLVIDKHAVKESIGSGVAASVQALGATSISLPGMGGTGRLSSSPSISAVSRGGSGVRIRSTRREIPLWNWERGILWLRLGI
jgi:hypothetical protein